MKKKNKVTPLRSKAGFWILIVAAFFLQGVSCVQYFYSREVIKSEAKGRAKSELRAAELEINVVTSQLETAVKSLAVMAEYMLDKPEQMPDLTHLLLETLPNVGCAGIAFTPDYYPAHGRWYEVYSSRFSPDSIETRQIGGPDHDYLLSEWFQNGMTIDSAWWSEPYFDDAGARAMVVTCSFPIRNKKNEVVAVALVDLSLDYLHRISDYLQVFRDSYYSICSSTGIDLVSRPDTVPGRKYMIYDEEIDATGWHISIIIPEDILYADLKRVGLLINILMILGVALLVFILYRSGKDLQRLMEVNSQKERMLNELEIARRLQMALLPKTFPPTPDRRDLSMYGLVLPAKTVGGDLYDFFEKDEKLYFCIGDVSGKGVPASLVMAIVRSLFRSLSSYAKDVADLATQLNDTLSENNEMNMFVTLFIGLLDMKTGKLSYCNAGHNAPVLLDNQGTKVDYLPTIPNLPIGVLSGYTFVAQNTTLRREDSLFLYTDGLTEAENARHELFGEERMMACLKQLASDSQNIESADASRQDVETMLQAVRDFVGKAEQSDDLTMLALKWLEDTNGNENQLPARHSIVMRNDIQQIPTLAEWIESLRLPSALNMSINLALEEAVTNVMLYAYPDESGQVLIEAEKTDKQVTFVISDNGIPFDPTLSPETDITLSAEERAIGGLGIHLVRQIMDNISYERRENTNILTLVKSFNN